MSNINQILRLAEAQANARLNAAKLKIERLKEELQLANDELFEIAHYKSDLDKLIFEHRYADEEPVTTEPPEEEASEDVEVYAAHNQRDGMASAWLVVAASSKEEAESLINAKSYGDLVTMPIEMVTGNLNKKVAAKSLNNPRVVHIMNSNSRKLREL